MNHPASFYSRRLSFASAIVGMVLVAYVAVTFFLYFYAVVPSFQQNSTSEVFAVDSTVYTYFADSIRQHRPDPWVLESLARFPNTLWAPVLISLLLKSQFAIMLFNYALFAVSLRILSRSCPISLTVFIPLLLLNPTTATSLLCVNKEVLDLFNLALFLYWRKSGRWAILVSALVLALFNRYELCVVMLAITLAESGLNPFRKRRFVTLLLLVGALNFIMPFWGSNELARRFGEAQSAALVRTLDQLQLHYLYVLAVIPKVGEDLYGFLSNTQVWTQPTSWVLIMFFNNLAAAIVTLILLMKRALKLRNDFIYFGAIGAAIVAQALVVQPRYFYFIYVLLCLQAAVRVAPADKVSMVPEMSRAGVHA
jgi:hypothetical protein